MKYILTVCLVAMFTAALIAPSLEKRECEHEKIYTEVDTFSYDLFEAEYEIELVSQEFVIIRNVYDDRQYQVNPEKINQFFILDNQ